MTVVDVNTGKFTGSGGNLEETVTRNNLEAAEEVVRQLRLRDIGGIIVVDFIDMVLELNRDLVLRRLVECLGRDRTRHQVAEVTSLGLVQMTRKKIGTGLLEAFGETCPQCDGRGVLVHTDPVPVDKGDDDGGRRPAVGAAASRLGAGADTGPHRWTAPATVRRALGATGRAGRSGRWCRRRCRRRCRRGCRRGRWPADAARVAAPSRTAEPTEDPVDDQAGPAGRPEGGGAGRRHVGRLGRGRDCRRGRRRQRTAAACLRCPDRRRF